MTRRASESGFTLLEILVASMLLAMLITILTMVFNSSSIAWSTGKASVMEMESVRRHISAANIVADNAMPGVETGRRNTWGYLVDPWDPSTGDLRRRAIVNQASDLVGNSGLLVLPNLNSGKGPWVYKDEKLWAMLESLSFQPPDRAKTYAVGVWSYGPDGIANSGDDISTWPDAD